MLKKNRIRQVRLSIDPKKSNLNQYIKNIYTTYPQHQKLTHTQSLKYAQQISLNMHSIPSVGENPDSGKAKLGSKNPPNSETPGFRESPPPIKNSLFFTYLFANIYVYTKIKNFQKK